MNQQQQLIKIGQGACGSVWAQRLSDDEVDVNDVDNNKTVIKREDCNSNRSITNEHNIHKHVTQSALATMASESKSNLITGYQVNIPTPVDFIATDSSQWDSLLSLLPPKFEPCRALISERIPPMSQPFRQLLAQKYIGGRGPQDEGFATILLDAVRTEQNCLVRPFLGRRRQPSPERPTRSFSLRNFPLHLDQIEELGLPKEQYAMAMADTLAFLHWEAEVDARDVEFVLARPRSQHAVASFASSSWPAPSIGSKAFSSGGVFGTHAMWLLDFDCCKKMAMPGAMDDDGIMATEVAFLEATAIAFWGNDPWYPRPPPPQSNDNGNGNHGAGSDCHLADGQLWEKFKGRYLGTSWQILEGKGEERMTWELPGKVMGIILKTRWRNGKLIYLEYEEEVN